MDVAENNGWLCLTISGKRQYGGNFGYDDDLQRAYRFDNFVPYSKQIKLGDILVIRDRTQALGFAEVRRLENGSGTKNRQRCPACRTTTIKEREHLQPRWRCKNGHECDSPLQEAVSCTKYTAWFEGAWVPATHLIPISMLRTACTKFVGQNSIQPINLNHLRDLLPEIPVEILPFLDGPDSSTPISTENSYTRPADTGPPEASVFRLIRARRGQEKFRKALLDQFGGRCVVCGSSFVDLLEAAHIYPYKTSADNRPANGLLLRSDIHTLFDLGLLGIDPGDLIIRIHPQARGKGYDDFDGRPLGSSAVTLDRSALEFRWDQYVRGCASHSESLAKANSR